MRSDKDRLLEWLRQRGPAGVTSREIRQHGVSGNPSARIADLEAAGYSFSVEYFRIGRRKYATWRLLSEPSAERGVVSVDPASGEQSGSTPGSKSGVALSGFTGDESPAENGIESGESLPLVPDDGAVLSGLKVDPPVPGSPSPVAPGDTLFENTLFDPPSRTGHHEAA